jgi:hypothetical protein
MQQTGPVSVQPGQFLHHEPQQQTSVPYGVRSQRDLPYAPMTHAQHGGFATRHEGMSPNVRVCAAYIAADQSYSLHGATAYRSPDAGNRGVQGQQHSAAAGRKQQQIYACTATGASQVRDAGNHEEPHNNSIL